MWLDARLAQYGSRIVVPQLGMPAGGGAPVVCDAQRRARYRSLSAYLRPVLFRRAGRSAGGAGVLRRRPDRFPALAATTGSLLVTCFDGGREDRRAEVTIRHRLCSGPPWAGERLDLSRRRRSWPVGDVAVHGPVAPSFPGTAQRIRPPGGPFAIRSAMSGVGPAGHSRNGAVVLRGADIGPALTQRAGIALLFSAEDCLTREPVFGRITARGQADHSQAGRRPRRR